MSATVPWWSSEPFVLASATIAAGSALAWLWLALFRTPPPDRAPGSGRLPAFWRLQWRPVAVIGAALERRVTSGARDALGLAVARAGLAGTLSPALVLGAQAVGSLQGLALGLAVAVGIDTAPAGPALTGAMLGAWLPRRWLADRAVQREREILRALPFLLDVLTLALEAGANLGSALANAVDRSPPGPLRDEFVRVLQDIRAGRARAEAFAALAERVRQPAIASLVAALNVAERQGASLGTVLRAPARQRRTERWLRAERLAMQAPVRMLLPLTVCIFPGTFAILLFPSAMRLLGEGLVR